jgi:2-polyprenyl-3-methyl-5-hydroxy-6-metoxy-1,4-benzoquinol methylase
MAAMKDGLRTLLHALPGGNRLWRIAREQLSPHARGLKAAREQSSGPLLQDSAFTLADRYPWLFRFLADQLSDITSPQILSFGCATGEEIFSLADYLPQARLAGIDINPHNIAVAKRTLAAQTDRDQIQFACAGSAHDEPDGHYDAILCLAVLRHGDIQSAAPDRCDTLIRFAESDRLVSDLARCLKPGGYLAIWHSQFRFADMTAAPQFEAVLSHPNGGRNNHPLYGPDNRRIDGARYAEAVFRKT